MDSLLGWLKSSVFSNFILNYQWAWPACETLHFIGMALLMGVIVAFDLRILGILKRISFAPLHRLLPWGVAGFVINLITGFLFFTGDPFQYAHNIAFQLKLLFIVLAGINVLVFYLVPFRQVELMGPGEDAPLSAKVIAGCSLFLWFGVIYLGRMLPFIGTAF